MTDQDRTRVRNRLYLIGLLPALLMLLVSGRIGLLLLQQSSGLADYGNERYAAAREDFRGNQVLAPFERWMAPFDEGTAQHRDEDWAGAISSYEDALEHVPTEWECAVRNNLALAHEAVGDAALEESRREEAEAAWSAGREALGECLELDSGDSGTRSDDDPESGEDERDRRESGDSNAGGSRDGDSGADGVDGSDRDPRQQEQDRETAGVIDERLADKLDQAAADPAQDPDEAQERDETQAERERRLAERNRRALEERRRQEQRQEDRRDQRDREDERSGTGQPPPPPEW